MSVPKYGESQKDGFPGDANAMSTKPRSLAADTTPFGTKSKPSGFRGKSLPCDAGSDNTALTPQGPNTGGGNR